MALVLVLHTLNSLAGCSSAGSLNSSVGGKRWKIMCRKMSPWEISAKWGLPCLRLYGKEPHIERKASDLEEKGRWLTLTP